jgi:hypothetical protein
MRRKGEIAPHPAAPNTEKMKHPPSVWQPTTIIRQELSLQTGTRTLKVVTDQGRGYLKALGNPEGPHVLACDLIGTRLAHWFGLPTFEYAILTVIPEFGLTFQEGNEVEPGPAFITKEDPGNSWGGTERELQMLINPDDLARLVIFDTWTLNCDRYSPEGRRINRDNVYLSEEAPPGRFRLRAMDFSHCFTCGRPLTPRIAHLDSVRNDEIYGLFPEFRPWLNHQVVRRAMDDIVRFCRADAQAVTEGLPREWDVDQNTRNALIDFLLRRAAFLTGSIMDKLCPAS